MFSIIVEHSIALIDECLPDRPQTVGTWFDNIKALDVVFGKNIEPGLVVCEPVLRCPTGIFQFLYLGVVVFSLVETIDFDVLGIGSGIDIYLVGQACITSGAVGKGIEFSYFFSHLAVDDTPSDEVSLAQ